MIRPAAYFILTDGAHVSVKFVKLLFVARLENMYYFFRQYYSLLDLLENPSLLQTSGFFVHELEL